MPLNKLENFIKNFEGRILYVNSNDLDATDSISNQGNSLTKPFKTIQRALIESARFSYLVGDNNDLSARTTILVFPGDHVIDNRPGYGIRKTGTAVAEAVEPNGNTIANAQDEFTLTLESNFDLTQEDNDLYKFNSVHGGVIIPRGTSLVGLDLRKTKIRPKYVPNPTDDDVPYSALFRITGLCYFWQFSIFDADESELAYTNNAVFTSGSGNLSLPTFSHHKLTCFEYADGVNVPSGYNETDLDMYYAKLSNAFNEGSGRQIPSAQKFPLAPDAFTKERPEWEIVGAFAADPISISSISSGDGATPSAVVSVATNAEHGLTVGTPIKIRGVNVSEYNISTIVATVTGTKQFTYLLPSVPQNLNASPGGAATVTIETDTVKGASPYIFNCSLRSVWGMNGMHADGKKAAGFKSMVVAQFTGISLQKDDRAFVKYNPQTRTYSGLSVAKVTGTDLSAGSASTNSDTVYHLDSNAVYRKDWSQTHIKITNDAILQIVSVFAIGYNMHFLAESGGDASITNSNSNFGQFALGGTGFKRDSFGKDNHGYITSIISPKAVLPRETNVDWISIDVGLTTQIGISSHLYLFGFNSKDNVPPNLIAGYRVGARNQDSIYLDLDNGQTRSAKVLMADNTLSSTVVGIVGTTSGFKERAVNLTSFSPDFDEIGFASNHNFQTGEKVIMISDDGDLPENIVENRTYFVITTSDPTRIKLASSLTNATNETALKFYGGSKLRILSRVSDRDSGDVGSPIQFDPNNNNWFVHVDTTNDIYTELESQGVAGFGEARTDVTYFKRIADNRSIDDKIYKVRLVIPKEVSNSKDPGDNFIIQESSTTGVRNVGDFTLETIDKSDFEYNRNPRFISTCSVSTNTVTVIAEQRHNLNVGDRVIIKNVRSSTNETGVGVTGFNGDFLVTAVPDASTFEYDTTDVDGITHNVGIFSGTATDTRTVNIPRFERNDLQSNLQVYRTDVIAPYEEGVQDGIYHLYVINSSNQMTEHFDYEYDQNVVDLYPQLDRDNYNDNPPAAKTFAKRSPIGEVVTNDLKKSTTRETIDKLIKKFGAPVVSSVTAPSVGVASITTELEHGFSGIRGFGSLTPGSGFVDGTYYNIKLLNSDASWSGAAAKVVISGAGNSVTSLEVTAPGSGYQAGATLNLDGFSGASIGITSEVLASPVNCALQITGIGTASDGLYRVASVGAENQIAIAKTDGDPAIYAGQYLFNNGPTAEVSGIETSSAGSTGISTLTCTSAHGLVVGNKFKVVDSSDNNLGDFIVNDTVGVTTIVVANIVNSNAHRVLKYAFAANNASSDVAAENLGARGISFYGNESAILGEDLTGDTVGISTIIVSAQNQVGGVGVGTTARFPLGSYIQINNEIMKVADSNLKGAGNNELVVIRGYLGTVKENHLENSLIKRITPLPVELRRPSILRASGQTFEYLGYGPGNYSTGLPQVQVRTLSEREDFLAQAQERSGGQVVYTGMNSDGDFFIGNTKYSASTGTQQTFDIPVSTITGQDPSRLSVVFDEVIVKERILVEGGKSNQILSQFDGPVTFNENITINDEVKLNDDVTIAGVTRITNDTQSTNCTSGALQVAGGVGIEKNLNVCGTMNVAGVTTFESAVRFNTALTADSTEGAKLGEAGKEWSEAWIAGVGIATEGVPGGTEPEDRLINGLTGPLRLNGNFGADGGLVRIVDKLHVAGLATFAVGSRHQDVQIGVSGAAEIDTASGNLTLDSAGGTVVVDDNLTVNGTFTLPATSNGGIFKNIRIAAASANTIDTSTGELVLDANGTSNVRVAADQLDVDNNLNVDGNTQIDGTLTVDGNTTLGDANTDTVTIPGILDVNGRADIDQIRIDGNTITNNSSGGHVNITGNSSGQGTGHINLQDDVDITGTLDISGNTTIGDDSGDSHTVNGTVDFEHAVELKGVTHVTNTTASSGCNSGAFQVDGGVGINGALHVCGGINGSLSGNAASSSLVEVESNNNSTTFHNIVFTATALDADNGDAVNAQLRADQSSGLQYRPSDETFRSDGDIIAFHSSDSRLKNNIKPIEGALAKILGISGNTFEWNDASSHSGPDTGVIAQEVKELGLPGLVTERSNGYLAVKYERLVPLLIEAIKELNAKVEELEDKLSDK